MYKVWCQLDKNCDLEGLHIPTDIKCQDLWRNLTPRTVTFLTSFSYIQANPKNGLYAFCQVFLTLKNSFSIFKK